jgi:hypothetical protein
MDDGEYTYELIADEKVIANGLLQIGEYKPTVAKYNNKNKIIQYNGK